MLAYLGSCLYDQPGGHVKTGDLPKCPVCHGWGFIVNTPKIDILGRFEPESIDYSMPICECVMPTIEEINVDEQPKS